jgi:hypothetical protein
VAVKHEMPSGSQQLTVTDPKMALLRRATATHDARALPCDFSLKAKLKVAGEHQYLII